MLTRRHLVTLRAALLFWQEEIAVHEPAVAMPYLDEPDIQPLSAAEIESLREQLRKVRYALFDRQSDRFLALDLLPTDVEPEQISDVATVILPG